MNNNNDTFPHATISAYTETITLVSVFWCEPKNQDELITRLISAGETLMVSHPGFISSSVHRADDGNKVINYAQFRALADLEAFRARPEAQAFFKEIYTLARVESDVCRVEFVQLGVDSLRPALHAISTN